MEIWFQDEARIGQQGSITRVWAEKGTRPGLVRQQQYEYAYIFGAVCPQYGGSCAIIMPQANTYAMNLHLKYISKLVKDNGHAVIVLDRAGWHTSKGIKLPKNITIIPLPAASPELNPQEQIWQHMRDKWLANRVFDGYDSIISATENAWNKITESAEFIKNLCSRSWAII